LKERYKRRKDEEEEVSYYRMIFFKKKDLELESRNTRSHSLENSLISVARRFNGGGGNTLPA
jgi:hypothetical protein